MSGFTAEIIEVCEAPPDEKRMGVIDFARFLLVRQDDVRWKNLIAEEKPRPRLDVFLRVSAAEAYEPFDLKRL